MSAPKDDPAAERRTPAEIAAALCEKASVVGAFDPWAMLAEVAPGLADAAVEDLVLSAVAPQVEEVPEGAEVLWRLRPEPRREVLGGLAARDALKAVIAATRPRALDRFGGYLQSALLTGAATPAAARRHASDADLPLQALALDFAHPIGVQKPAPARAGVTAKPQPLDPRIEIARRAERSRQDYVAPQRLIGRDGEAAALDRYVADGAVIAPLSRLPTPAGAPPRLRPLLLTGIGGSGKSALVADLMRRTQGADWSGPIVVCLDFDQRGIALGGEREWLNEVTRQMGFMRPTLDGPLAVVRSETRQRLDALLKDREGFDRLSGTEGLSVFATMRARLAQVLADDASAPSLARDTLVVVLDTFEEILVRSDLAGPDPEQEPFGLVLAFVDSLARLSGPDGKPILGAVRAVAAGRVAPFADDPARLGQWFEAHNEVGELDLHSAAEFLRLRGSKRIFTPERALRLAGAFPRYPLVLILLVAFARGRTARDLDSLTRGLGPDHLLGTEAATRALYSRFLERLKDHRITDPKTGDDRVVSAADLRRIAHPGLALPVVTPRLIREVLAEPTGLGPIDAARARDLFTALSREVWLVERAAAADAIRHVPALRRIMLPMLNGDVPLAQAADTKLCERVRAVHRAAAAWYRAAGSGEPEARAMAAYHEVFLGEVTALEHDPVLARQVLDVAGDDIYAMPIDARALLRREDVSAAGLSAAETVALPAAERRSAEAARQQRRTKAGVSLRFLGSMPLEAAAPMDSLSTYREAVEAGLAERGGGRRQAEVLADRELAQFVEARFAEADFQGVLAHALPAVIDLVADAGDDPPLDMVGDIVTHWVWKWALSCLATGTGDERLLRWATPAGVRSIGRGARPGAVLCGGRGRSRRAGGGRHAAIGVPGRPGPAAAPGDHIGSATAFASAPYGRRSRAVLAGVVHHRARAAVPGRALAPGREARRRSAGRPGRAADAAGGDQRAPPRFRRAAPLNGRGPEIAGLLHAIRRSRPALGSSRPPVRGGAAAAGAAARRRPAAARPHARAERSGADRARRCRPGRSGAPRRGGGGTGEARRLLARRRRRRCHRRYRPALAGGRLPAVATGHLHRPRRPHRASVRAAGAELGFGKPVPRRGPSGGRLRGAAAGAVRCRGPAAGPGMTPRRHARPVRGTSLVAPAEILFARMPA